MKAKDFVSTKVTQKRLDKFLNVLNSEIIDIPKLRELSWIGIPDSTLSRSISRFAFFCLETTYWLLATCQVYPS